MARHRPIAHRPQGRCRPLPAPAASRTPRATTNATMRIKPTSPVQTVHRQLTDRLVVDVTASIPAKCRSPTGLQPARRPASRGYVPQATNPPPPTGGCPFDRIGVGVHRLPQRGVPQRGRCVHQARRGTGSIAGWCPASARLNLPRPGPPASSARSRYSRCHRRSRLWRGGAGGGGGRRGGRSDVA